ncbi:hypothetical protein BOX15_Mlig022402g1 [Macrostomum lignano]|uniref:Uncharacterized protein n=1 Tax=Macrostomum lignano TaxID=282301 RepID=A0A267GWG4_9PLAT|nr:hypothetical protein BOX15_Mlig022402g1 [Macrostomum lignano]
MSLVPISCCLLLFSLATVCPINEAALPGTLSIALCTPENSACKLAGDGDPTTCFVAHKMEENFYFAVFNLVGQLVKVSELKLLAGGAGRTNYSVSLASNARAHELRCKSVGDANKPSKSAPHSLDCFTTDGSSAGELENVSSLMIRSEPLVIQMRLLEVVAYSDDRQPIPFAYCSVAEPGVCGRAMDGQLASDSPAVVSGPAVFPSWYGGFNSSSQASVPVSSVRIYRPDNGGATFFRVASAGVDCIRSGEASISKDGVEAIDFACTASKLASSSLVEVWELDADFLVNLCEIQVFGREH